MPGADEKIKNDTKDSMITIEDLKVSPVTFHEGNHTYDLEGKKLSGITGLIHSILGLGVYPEADDYTKGYLIPHAGSRGTAVHHAIQTYDELGIFDPHQIVFTTYFKGESNEYEAEENWDVSHELNCYIANKEGGNFEALTNEYTVSDEKQYASQIDNVWISKETQGIWLFDTKTNNIDLYPKCGYFNPRFFRNGKEALKEYLSWQLSIYAYLFELQNPGIKVEGLGCNWLRKDDHAMWIIERKSDELVKELLSSECRESDNGFVYYHPNLEVFGITGQLTPVEETLPILPEDVIAYMVDLNARKKEIDMQMEEAKTALRRAMTAHNVTKCDLGMFTATLSAPSKAKTLDTARLKKEKPEIYNQYIVEKERKESLTIKFRENE